MNKKITLLAFAFLSLFLIASLSSAYEGYYYPQHTSYTSVQNSKSYYTYNNENTAKYYLSNYDLYYRPIFSAPRERDFGHGVQYVRFRLNPIYYSSPPAQYTYTSSYTSYSYSEYNHKYSYIY